MLQKLFNPEWQITSKSFLLSSFLIGFSFSPTVEISWQELEFEESLPRKTASKRGLDRSQMEQPIKKKKNFLTLQISPSASSTRDLGFVHKRSGNEIIRVPGAMRRFQAIPSSSVVEHPTRSRRVVGLNPIWHGTLIFFRVYVSPKINVGDIRFLGGSIHLNLSKEVTTVTDLH